MGTINKIKQKAANTRWKKATKAQRKQQGQALALGRKKAKKEKAYREERLRVLEARYAAEPKTSATH